MNNAPRPATIHLAVLQPALRRDAPTANMHTLRQMVEHARREGPLDLVVLPEVFDGRRPQAEAPDAAADADGRQFLITLARACDVHVVGGSLVVPGDGNGASTVVNRCYVVERGGRPVGHYDKQRLFSREQEFRTPGASDGVFVLGGIRVGVAICADLWWPEIARRYVGRVDVLCVPARTGVPTYEHATYARQAWHALSLTRAMENGLAVAVSDWAPPSLDRFAPRDASSAGPRQWTAAVSGVFDPSHRPDMDRMKTLAPQEPACVRAQIDLAGLAAYRAYRGEVGLLPDENAFGAGLAGDPADLPPG